MTSSLDSLALGFVKYVRVQVARIYFFLKFVNRVELEM